MKPQEGKDRIIRFNTEHDLWFEIAHGVQRHIRRAEALKAIKHTNAMNQIAVWATFSVKP